MQIVQRHRYSQAFPLPAFGLNPQRLCRDRRLFAVDKGGRCCSDKLRLRWRLSKLLLPTQKMSSQYAGVAFNNTKSKWRAQLSIQSRRTHLGFYKQEAAAAKARDK